MLKPAIAIAAAVAAAQADSGAIVGLRLSEVRSFAKAEGDKLWPGYGTAPFGFLLISGRSETLLCRDRVPDGFIPAGADSSTGCARFTRPRAGLPDNLLAAMPLFGPPSVIVMGTPETTGRTEANWVRTILHEHFHQWQNALPDYFPRTLALGLAGGDRTGMWMLNYPFPYDRADVAKAQSEASGALADALAARRTPDFYAKFDAYRARRWAFAAAAGQQHWRYIELQLWQEGVARWTEITLGKTYPDRAVAQSAAKLEERTLADLRSPDLPAQKREFVYSYGAGEAMLMEACGPRWRDRYPSVLELGVLLNDSRLRCERKF